MSAPKNVPEESVEEPGHEEEEDSDDGEDSSADEDPWRLFSGPRLACRGIAVEGWLAQSFTWNPENSPGKAASSL